MNVDPMEQANDLFAGTAQYYERYRVVTEIHKTHIWTADSIVGYLYSTSFASRAVLGNLQKSFEDDLRERLSRLSAADQFEEIEFSIVSARVIA
jgi:hypothetical protein